MIWASKRANATFRVDRRQTWDHLAEASTSTIKYRNGPHGGWIGQHISPWIRCRKRGASLWTLVVEGFVINLPCAHGTQRSCKSGADAFIKGCPVDCWKT